METRQGAIRTLTWTEDITLNNVESFRQALEQLLAERADQLIVNMEAVNYINSAGLGMIADSVMAARAQQKELVVAGYNDWRTKTTDAIGWAFGYQPLRFMDIGSTSRLYDPRPLGDRWIGRKYRSRIHSL